VILLREWEPTEDEREEQCLPTREVSQNRFDTVRLPFWNSADPGHSLSSKFDFLRAEIWT
jgi:hypothetical protein